MKTNLKYTLPMLALAATGALCSCDDEDNNIDNPSISPDPNKELVSFTSEDGNIGTRAGLHSTKTTKIVARFKSEDIESTDGHTKGNPRYTRTVLQATAELAADHESSDDKIHKEGLSETHSDVNYPSAQYFRYWDDAYGRFAKISVYAVAVPGKDAETVLSDNILVGATSTTQVSGTNTDWFYESTENETCTWSVPEVQTASSNEERDLCYSNNIKDGGKKGVYKYVWNSENKWVLDKPIKDGQLFWREQSTGSTVGKFDQGNLIFKHALSKITINLTEGNGFDNSSNTDFNFATNTNVELLSFPSSGKLNIETGVWSDMTQTNIKKLQETTSTTPADKTIRTVTGLTLPGKTLDEVSDNAIHFVIDDNDYYVTCNQIAKAIQTYYKADGDNPDATLAAFTKMNQGQHYVINITVSKTKIENITAQLIGWEEVNSADIDPSNAYISVNLEERKDNGEYDKFYGDGDGDKFNIYRKTSILSNLSTDYNSYITDYNAFADYNWLTQYEGPATKSWNSTKNVWQTEWYWENNLSYYHLRVAGANDAKGNPTIKVKDSEVEGDYYFIKGGNIASSSSDYHDYIWGAPFTNVNTKGDDADASVKFVYTSENGFNQQTLNTDNTEVLTSQIYKAIGPTNNKINMMLFHMTSQVKFVVKTTTDNSKVALQTTNADESTNETKIELLRFYQNGTVLMGTGRVKEYGATTDAQEIEFVKYVAQDGTNPAQSTLQYGVVPQPLVRSGGTTNDYKVGLRITTPDGNQYVIQDISTVQTSAVSSVNLQNPYAESSTNTGKYIIDRWYPGYQYTYTVTISKTKIENITAQLVDWETVTGDLGEINLEGTN